ncbi:MAG TPA: zf-HC2 domain-containing protein, partial [Gemmataceae bacterium]|nr:zf-HC2 domain-containing protein [Gemmataceae bacterium]
MLTCTACTELLLDYLYGLLDDAEAEGLRQHLAGCATCQQALAQAKVQQNLLAQAARKYQEVPLFELPADEIAVLPMVAAPAKLPAATLPMSARRTSALRRWLPLAAAAAVLLAVGTGYASYQSGLDNRQKALADARKQVETIDAKLVSLRKDTESEVRSLSAKTQGQFLHVQVLGPASYQPSAANAYRLTTNTPTGQPADARVKVKVLDKAAPGEAEKVIFSEEIQSKGELRFTLPAKLPVAAGSSPRLVIEAGTGAAKEVIEQPLSVSEPSYVTHVATNKSVFHGGDTIFFRTLTLDRYALTPIDRPLALSCNLYHVAGGNLAPVKELLCTTQSGGIAGGEIVLPANAPYGPYLLTVAEVPDNKDKQTQVRPVNRPLLVEPGGKGGNIAEAKKDLAKAKVAAAPAVGQRLTADFFPEGGDLVAGTPNRVYFRLQHLPVLAKNLEVVVENSQKQEITKVALNGDTVDVGNQKLGSFAFTPEAGQSYRFWLKTGGKALDSSPLLAVRANGVALTVPNAIVPPGKPIQVKVRSADKPLLVMVSCRGHIVDQRIIEKSDKLTDVTLEPAPGDHGVLRVTVYEKDGKNWQPAAERLVYRQPTHTLKVTANFPNLQPKPENVWVGKSGDRVEMQIEATKESGAKAATWTNALVIDQTALKNASTPEPGVPAFFLLGGELHDPEDLEDADFLLTDAPNAAKALDLFLGTQGWRRFVSKQADSPVTLTASRGPADVGQLALFTAGNSSEAALAKFAATVNKQQEEIAQQANQQRETLLTERDSGAERARAAAGALAEFEQLPMTWLRYGVGAAVAIFLIVGTVLLAWGLFVAVRARSSPRLML